MSEERRQQYRNSEAKFASPETDEGIGYYWDGEQVSPDEFSRLVAEKSDRIKAERAESKEDE